MRRLHVACVVLLGAVVNLLPGTVHGQLGYSQESTVCVPDLERLNEPRKPPGTEPRSIDPVTVVPPPLRTKVTVQWDRHPLDDAMRELQEIIGMPVVVDAVAFSDVGEKVDLPISIELADEPGYLLLERLLVRQPGLGWYCEDDVLHISTTEIASEQMTTGLHSIADLIANGFERGALRDTVASCVDANWGISIQNDFTMTDSVLAANCPDLFHRQIRGLLDALRSPGELTYVDESTENIALRDRLKQQVDISCDSMPLTEFVETVAAAVGVRAYVDVEELKEVGIPADEPITVEMTGRPAATLLKVVLDDFQLVAVPRNGEYVITSAERADDWPWYVVAVFSVADISSTSCEAEELVEMIESQTDAFWLNVDGTGGAVCSPKHDVLAVRGSDRAVREVAQLLAEYRQLRKSVPTPAVDYTELETRYYEVSAQTAADLLVAIPELVDPGTWKLVTDAITGDIATVTEDGVGSLIRVATSPSVRDLQEPVFGLDCPEAKDSTENGKPQVRNGTLVTPQATLIIRHTKLTQLKIARLIERLSRHNFGENDEGQPIGRSGGFGGGFFYIAGEGSVAVPTRAP